MKPFFEFDNSVQIPFLNEIYLRVFGSKYVGSVVDVGAYDGKTLSNCYGLILRGWSALLIEPVNEHFQKLLENLEHRQNCTFRNVALGASLGSGVIFKAGALSTLNPDLIEEYKKFDWSKNAIEGDDQRVDISTLDIELKHFLGDKSLDLLIIDTEGYETQVMEGFTISEWKPKMLIIELADFHPDIETTRLDHKRLYQSILDAGYVVIYKDAINTMFLEGTFWSTV
jgi:FkbM family methyltransferase